MPVLNVGRADVLKEEDILIFEDSAADILDEHAQPARVERWREADEAGLLCLAVPEAYGGDFRHETALMEQMAWKDVSGFLASLHERRVDRVGSTRRATFVPSN